MHGSYARVRGGVSIPYSDLNELPVKVGAIGEEGLQITEITHRSQLRERRYLENNNLVLPVRIQRLVNS